MLIKDRIERSIRQKWLSILAKASVEDLENICSSLKEKPPYDFLRPPEIGLIMVRARTGGTGNPFHLGEMTVTRCTVQVKEGYRGTAYVMGRNKRHAELAALLDALLQDPDQHHSLMDFVIRPLEHTLQKRKALMAEKVASTRVEFFTMVRGEEG